MTESAHILIVDDEAPIRDFCQRTLSALSHRVKTAENGTEALKLFKAESFDIVITDLTMPGPLNGYGLLEEIKHCSPTTDVIVITAFPALESAIPILKQGAYDYLIKPIDQSLLKSVVSRCLEKRRLSEDLNREKRLRQDLEAAYAQLQEMEQLKEGFMARVNHELRMPLAPAFLAVDLLIRSTTEPQTKDLCTMLQGHLNQLQGLIETLLLFADLKKRDFDFLKAQIHLKDLLSGLIDRFQGEWKERELNVTVQIDPGAEWLWADPELMETAFKQLLINAIRFNQKNGSILIAVRKTRTSIEIAFEDTGIGIPENQIPKIFDGFYQVAHYLTREVGGLGLGLALARRIIELQGGTLQVQSQEGQGSRFIIALPYDIPSKKEKEMIPQ